LINLFVCTKAILAIQHERNALVETSEAYKEELKTLQIVIVDLKKNSNEEKDLLERRMNEQLHHLESQLAEARLQNDSVGLICWSKKFPMFEVYKIINCRQNLCGKNEPISETVNVKTVLLIWNVSMNNPQFS
jgi:hypothetical protein